MATTTGTAETTRSRATRAGRGARTRSRARRRGCVQASTTHGYDLCWGSSFLNNRYHHPETGSFISVDPLVTRTAEPYIYGSGNPVRFSDPNGLCTQRYDGLICADQFRNRRAVGVGQIADAIWLTASEINTNSSDHSTQHIRDVREPTLTRGGMWLATFGAGWLVDLGQSGDALARFAWRFKTGGKWDIKQRLSDNFYETTWNGTTWQIRKDVFGNIHYGAVLDEAGLTAAEATTLAGLGENVGLCGTGSGGFDCHRPLKPIIGANSAVDDFATNLGYQVERPPVDGHLL